VSKLSESKTFVATWLLVTLTFICHDFTGWWGLFACIPFVCVVFMHHAPGQQEADSQGGKGVGADCQRCGEIVHLRHWGDLTPIPC